LGIAIAEIADYRSDEVGMEEYGSEWAAIRACATSYAFLGVDLNSSVIELA
jgi:hypothetical protein